MGPRTSSDPSKGGTIGLGGETASQDGTGEPSDVNQFRNFVVGLLKRPVGASALGQGIIGPNRPSKEVSLIVPTSPPKVRVLPEQRPADPSADK